MTQSRDDFLDAQRECYICAWIGHTLGSATIHKLPKNLSKTFRFLFDGNRFDDPDGDYEYLVLAVNVDTSGGETMDGLPLKLHFFATSDGGKTWKIHHNAIFS